MPGMTHAPEPWSVERYGNIEYGNEGQVTIDHSGHGSVVDGVTREDGERICLCINACCGISTEELEKIVAFKASVADSVSADAANLLVSLGWKVTDKEGVEWE